MMIESRQTPNGPRLHVDFARFTHLPVQALYKEVKIWSFTESAAEHSRGGPRSRYMSVYRVDVLPAVFSE